MTHQDINRKKSSFTLKFFFLLFLLFVADSKILSQSVELNLKGNKNFSVKEYSSWVKLSSINIKEKSFPDSIKSRIFINLERRGFFSPKIYLDSVKFNVDTTSAKVFLRINEGNVAILTSIKLTANDSLDSASIIEKLQSLINKPFIPKDFNLKLNSILNYYGEKGFPFARFTVNNVSFIDSFRLKMFLKFDLGVATKIDKIKIKGNTKTKDYVIIRNIRIKQGEKYDESKIKDIPRLLKRLNFFKSVTKPKFFFDSKKRGVLSFGVKEKSTNYFDGIVGYIPKTGNRKGYFTGSVQIDLRNLFGTERAFGIKWNKTDENSQYFEINYLEPWVFGLPINISGNVNQKTQDTTYIKRNYSLSVNYLATENLSTAFIYSFGETIPTGDLSKFTVFHSTFVTSGLQFMYDNRDDYFIPTRGFFVIGEINFSRKNILGPKEFFSVKQKVSEDYFKGSLEAGFFISPVKRNVAALTLHLKGIKGNGLEVSDLFRFGGTNSVRGFRFEQFSGDKVAWTNLEYRHLFSEDTYGFLFFDSGYFNNSIANDNNGESELIYGYGLGVSFPTGLGNMKLSFALGKGDSFSEGKLHFGIVGRF